MSKTKEKFYVFCPQCKVKYPGKKMIHSTNRVCNCGYKITDEEMNKQLQYYQQKKKLNKILKEDNPVSFKESEKEDTLNN